MPTVAAAFQSFLAALELTDRERAEASRQQEEVRQRLQRSLGGVRTSLLMGSYRRGTAIRPLGDIDVFVLLEDSAHGDLRHQPPLRLLEQVHRALRDSYLDHRPRIQGRSVNLEFVGTGIGYDIVPAFASGPLDPAGEPVEFEIPDRNQSAWIKTNPRLHMAACVAANARAGGMLNGLIKAAKLWNREHGERLRSFHLEVMSYSAFQRKPSDPRTGLRDLFQHLATSVMSPCADPAQLGPALDTDLTPADRADARNRLREAAVTATRAVLQEGAGDDAGAGRAWRLLLGPTFPC